MNLGPTVLLGGVLAFGAAVSAPMQATAQDSTASQFGIRYQSSWPANGANLLDAPDGRLSHRRVLGALGTSTNLAERLVRDLRQEEEHDLYGFARAGYLSWDAESLGPEDSAEVEGRATPTLGPRSSSRKVTNFAGQSRVKDGASADSIGQFAVWFAVQDYGMEEFNAKLRREGNKTITTGLSVGVEVGGTSVTIPKLGSLRLPLGVEFLTASSKSPQSNAMGSAVVRWQLPVVGVSVTPAFRLPFRRMYFQPLGVGVYLLGTIVPANLRVSDRPGYLRLSGLAVGTTSQAGIEAELGSARLGFALGWRWLNFTDVSTEGKDGFRVEIGGPLAGKGALSEALGYGGGFLRLRVTLPHI